MFVLLRPLKTERWSSTSDWFAPDSEVVLAWLGCRLKPLQLNLSLQSLTLEQKKQKDMAHLLWSMAIVEWIKVSYHGINIWGKRVNVGLCKAKANDWQMLQKNRLEAPQYCNYYELAKAASDCNFKPRFSLTILTKIDKRTHYRFFFPADDPKWP